MLARFRNERLFAQPWAILEKRSDETKPVGVHLLHLCHYRGKGRKNDARRQDR